MPLLSPIPNEGMMEEEAEEEEEAVAPTEGVGKPGATGATEVFPSSKMQTSHTE